MKLNGFSQDAQQWAEFTPGIRCVITATNSDYPGTVFYLSVSGGFTDIADRAQEFKSIDQALRDLSRAKLGAKRWLMDAQWEQREHI